MAGLGIMLIDHLFYFFRGRLWTCSGGLWQSSDQCKHSVQTLVVAEPVRTKNIQMVIAYGNPPPQQTWRWPDFMNLEGDIFWGSQKIRVQFPLISYQKSGWTRHPKFDRFSVNTYHPETIFSFQYFPVALCSTGRDQRRFFAYPSRPIEGKYDFRSNASNRLSLV